MKLYEISKELATVHNAVITAEGEITPELEAQLDSLNLALVVKAEGIRKWFANVESDVTALDMEIKRLQRLAQIQENLKERLKEYVKKNMLLADTKKLETPIGAFTIVPNPPSVEIPAPELVPDQFKVCKFPLDKVPEDLRPLATGITIQNAEVKKALQDGYDVPGAKLIEPKKVIEETGLTTPEAGKITHLRIK